ncbi:MAG: hypothetical protein V1913_07440 [Fibrobacterota bacterium]
MKNEAKVARKKYTAPSVKSELIFETLALGCAQCLNIDPQTADGWGDGNCEFTPSNY